MNRRLGLGCAALALACSPEARQASPAAERVRLPPSVAAKVGSEEIAIRTVSRIAEAQHVSLAAAREYAIRDALFALGARAAFEGRSIAPVLGRAALARALLEGFKAEAVARGPATDAEVAELTALRWQDLDRPEAVRTTHAVALAQGPNLDQKAKAVAQRISEAVRGVTDPAEFIRLAEGVPHEGVQVRAESLPAVTADGRVYYPENAPPDAASQHFDSAFSRAVSQLTVGQISEPVKSDFGYHVVLCEARFPAQHVPLEERRRLLADEVIKGRAERAKQELLGRLSSQAAILITRSVEDLTASVRFPE